MRLIVTVKLPSRVNVIYRTPNTSNTILLSKVLACKKRVGLSYGWPPSRVYETNTKKFRIKL